MANMRRVVINRKRWKRGGLGEAALRTHSGQSCCLGFVARVCGLRTPTGTGTFSDLIQGIKDDKGEEAARDAAEKLPALLRPSLRADGHWIDSELHEEMVVTNDDSTIEPAERESKIAEGLATAGLKIIFED